jgi:hypothetical protein
VSAVSDAPEIEVSDVSDATVITDVLAESPGGSEKNIGLD